MSIEPTEEQKQAADAFMLKTRIAEEDSPAARRLARLLAEREAKLATRLEAVLSVLDPDGDCDTDLDGEHLRRFVCKVLDAHVAGGEQGARGEVEALKEENDTLQARVAELEAERADTVGCEGCGKRLPYACAIPTEDPVYLCARCISPMHMEREAQHLADIKAAKDALEQARPSVEAWVTSDAEDVDSDADALQAIDEVLERLAPYDDAKADAPAVSPEMGALRARVAEMENTNKTLRARVNELEEMLPPKGRERSGPWANNIDDDDDE